MAVFKMNNLYTLHNLFYPDHSLNIRRQRSTHNIYNHTLKFIYSKNMKKKLSYKRALLTEMQCHPLYQLALNNRT